MSARPDRMSPAPGGASAGRDRWLLSYADFMTLLLALFVILYASARVDAAEDRGYFAGLKAAFFFEESSPTPVPTPPANPMAEPRPASAVAPASPDARLEEDLAAELESQRLRAGDDLGASLYRSERGLVISLASAEFPMER